MDAKLDEILKKLTNVSTKDDVRAVNRRIDGIEDRLEKIENARATEEAARKASLREQRSDRRNERPGPAKRRCVQSGRESGREGPPSH